MPRERERKRNSYYCSARYEPVCVAYSTFYILNIPYPARTYCMTPNKMKIDKKYPFLCVPVLDPGIHKYFRFNVCSFFIYTFKRVSVWLVGFFPFVFFPLSTFPTDRIKQNRKRRITKTMLRSNENIYILNAQEMRKVSTSRVCVCFRRCLNQAIARFVLFFVHTEFSCWQNQSQKNTPSEMKIKHYFAAGIAR